MCRTQLPVWQQYLEERGDPSVTLLAVAMDVQGPERVRTFVEGRGYTYRVLVDSEDVLGRVYGFRAIPNVFVVDAAGILRYQRLSTFTIKKPEIRGELSAALAGLETSHGEMQAPSGEAAQLFARGVASLREGRRDEALALWRRAVELDPENFIVRKQLWAVQAPERFYPEIDVDWQKERLERGE